jgi:hypothetical protein
VKATAAVAYVCDGRRTEAWLKGTATNGKLSLAGRDGNRLTGSIQGNAVFGTVWVGATRWPYSAQVAKRPAGLYRADAVIKGLRYRIGWIIRQNGQQVGIEAGPNGSVASAPALKPPYRAANVDGTNVPVLPLDGDATFPS